MVKVILLKKDENIEQRDLHEADVVASLEESKWHVNVIKNKVNGWRGSVHKSVFVACLEENK